MSQSKLALFALFLAFPAAADIPDRVNYEKFRDLYQTQKQVSDQARSDANSLHQTFQLKVQARKRLEQQKTDLQEAVRRDRATIDRHNLQITTVDGQAATNREKIAQNDARLATLNSDNASLSTRISNKDFEVQRQSQLTRTAETARNDASTQLLTTEQKHADTLNNVRQSEGERDRLANDLFNTQPLQQALNFEMGELRHEVKQLETELATAVPANTAFLTQIQNLNQRKSALEQRKAVLDAKPNKTPAEIQELTKLTTTDLPLVVTQLKTATQAQEKLSQRIAHLNRRLPLAKQRLAEAFQEDRRLDRQVADLRRDLDAAKLRIRQMTDVAAEWANLVQTRRFTFQTADASFQTAANRLRTLSGELNVLRRQFATNQTEIRRLETDSQSLQNLVASQEQQIASLRNAVSLLESAIATREGQIAVLETNITTAQTEETAASTAYQTAETLAQTEETSTAAALTLSQQVFAQYSQEKSAATKEGQTDGSAAGGKEGSERGQIDGKAAGTAKGDQDGTNQGTRDGKSRDYRAGYAVGDTRGRNEGTTKGTADGKQSGLDSGAKAGYAEGLKEGEANGRKDGYQAGHDEGYAAENNETNFKTGYDKGFAKGLARAQSKAKAEDFPKGRTQGEQDILNSAPQNKTDIDNTPPPPESPQARRQPGHGWLITEAFAADPGNISIPPVTPNGTYKSYLKTYEHPDFDKAYQGAYDSTYHGSFQGQYRATYDAAFRAAYSVAYQPAYDTAFAVDNPTETTRGDANGYQAGYNAVYRPAFVVAETAAYNQVFATSKAAALPVNYPKGFAAGKAEGLVAGKLDGTNHALAEGETKGTPEGFDNNIVAERAKAFEAGKLEITAEYQNSYRPKLLSVKLVDLNGTGKFAVWEKAQVEMVVRNFGGRTAPDNTFTAQVKDTQGNFLGSNLTRTLKALPGNTEATYKNAVTGTPIGGHGGVKINVSLLEGTKTLATQSVTQAVDQDLQVVVTNSQGEQPMLIGGLNQWFGNRLWIKNLSTTKEVTAGLRVRVTTKSQILQVDPKEWLNALTFPSIAADQWSAGSISVSSNRYGTFNDEEFLVEIKDHEGYLIYVGTIKAPTKITP